MANPPPLTEEARELVAILGEVALHFDELKADKVARGIRKAITFIERTGLEVTAARVIEAARCIRHWHDTGKDGMVVSAEHVRKLWDALSEFDRTSGGMASRCADEGDMTNE